MTAGVKKLTDRATTPLADSATTQSARDIQAFVETLVRLGHDARALLTAANLTPKDLEDPDARIPCTATGAILEKAHRDRPTTNLALKMAAETPIGAYPLLDYLVLTSETVGDGYRQLARYLRLVSSPAVLAVSETAAGADVLANAPGNPFAAEYGLTLSVFHFRRETEGRFRPDRLELIHVPDDVAELEERLQCGVHPRSERNALRISAAAWRLPLRRRDPQLRALLALQADEIARTWEAKGMATEVRRALAVRVAGGDMRIQSVARHLATSPRTLQRRLAEETTSYQELVEATRRQAAEGYLGETTLSAGEIGYLLGYSEPAAFHRAFRRWHGQTPAAFRLRRRRKPNKRQVPRTSRRPRA